MKLKDELKTKHQEFDAMRKVNVDYAGKLSAMKSEKLRVEAELEAYKRKFVELEKIFLSTKNESVAEPVTKVKNLKIIQTGDQDDDQELISMLKRKCVSSEIKEQHHNDDDIMQIGMKKTKNLQDLHHHSQKHEVKNVQSPLDSSHSNSGSDNEDIDGVYKSISAKRSMRKEGWEFEADMLAGFYKNDMLCLNAVCTLHRQRIRGKLSSFGSQLIPPCDIKSS